MMMSLIHLQNRYSQVWLKGIWLLEYCSWFPSSVVFSKAHCNFGNWEEGLARNVERSPTKLFQVPRLFFFPSNFRELCCVLDSINYICCMGPGAFIVLSLYHRTSHRGCWTLSLQHIEEQDKQYYWFNISWVERSFCLLLAVLLDGKGYNPVLLDCLLSRGAKLNCNHNV